MKENISNIEIRAPTIREEFEHLKYVLKNKEFYEKNGYKVSYPNVPELRDPTILNDNDKMFSLFRDKEYDVGHYTSGIKVILNRKEDIEMCITKLKSLCQYWNFKYFPKYLVIPTKYGPGGSYNPNQGHVILLITREGGSNREHSHTILHEITHIGIEDSIVSKYALNHSEKERLVDLIVKIMFPKELPDYYIQKIGDSRLDSYINAETINILPKIIESYTTKFPR